MRNSPRRWLVRFAAATTVAAGVTLVVATPPMPVQSPAFNISHGRRQCVGRGELTLNQRGVVASGGWDVSSPSVRDATGAFKRAGKPVSDRAARCTIWTVNAGR